MKPAKKGQYGYISFEKKWTALRTAAFFGISLALFLTGYYMTKPHTKMNLLTVVAVLGCLPASKSAVNMIMFLKSRGCGEALYREVSKRAAGVCAVYDLVLTTYQKTYTVPSLVIKDHTICGYMEHTAGDASACGQYLEEMLVRNGLKGYSVKIFTEREKYVARAGQLGRSQEHSDGQAALRVILALAL